MAAEQIDSGDSNQKPPAVAGSHAHAAVHREATSKESMRAYQDTQLVRTEPRLPALQIVDAAARNSAPAKAERSADAIQQALHGGLTKYTGIGADGQAVLEILRNSTANEKAQIDSIYRTKYGTSLNEELSRQYSGAQLDRALNILYRKDNNRADDAGNIHASLIERNQVFFGRSDKNIERDLRDTVSTMNSTQIATLDRDYKNRYGVSLESALLQDPNLSKSTKDSLSIYLKGTDKRTPQDTMKLASIALDAENLTMLTEAFRGTSPDVRRQFAEQGGMGKLRAAFGAGTDDFKRARQLTSEGKLSAAQLVRDNTGTFNDNESAIDLVLKAMTEEERRAYQDGKSLSTRSRQNLNADQLKSVNYFSDLNSALQASGNSTEVAAWESLIASPSGSLINDLSKHQGVFSDSDTGAVISTVENMSKEDWQRFKANPEYRREVQVVLSNFLSSSELSRVNEVLQRKLNASTFEESKREGYRPILDAVSDNEHLFGNDKTKIVDAVRTMTSAEQHKYREDATFRRDLDSALTSALGGRSPEFQITRGLLDRVARGQQPEQGLAETILSRSVGDRDGAQAMRDLESALSNDPGLRQRLLHPTTSQDTRIIDALNRALPDHGSQRGFERYVKPLLETGFLPMEKRFELDRDLHNVLIDITKVTADEKTRILLDESTQRRFLGRFTSEERFLTLNVLRQGHMDTADTVREFSLTENVDGLKSTLSTLQPAELQQLRQSFARKYGDLTGQVLDRLSGDDKNAVAFLLRDKPLSSREAFNDSRAPVYTSQDGLGRWFVNNLDGTSYQLDNALNEYSARISDASRKFSELPAAEQERLNLQVTEVLREYKSSEATAASVATDVVIVAGTVGTTMATGGVSLVVLGAVATGGAVAKVGINAAIRGADYDNSAGNVTYDAVTGGANAAINLFGAGQAGRLIGLGEVAARESAGALLATAAGRALVREGQEQALQRGLTAAMRNALSNGASQVDQAALRQVVSSVAVSGQEAALLNDVTASLNRAVQGTAHKALIEIALNAGANGVGNATVTFGDGLLQGKSIKAAGSDALVAGTIGVVAGGTLTGTIKGGSAAYRFVRGSSRVHAPVASPSGIVSRTSTDVSTAHGSEVSSNALTGTQTGAVALTETGAARTNTGAAARTEMGAAARTEIEAAARTETPTTAEIAARNKPPTQEARGGEPRTPAVRGGEPAPGRGSETLARDAGASETPTLRDTTPTSTAETPESWDARSNPQPLTREEIDQWKKQIDELRASNDAEKIELARRAEMRVKESEAWHKTAADFPVRSPEELAVSRRLVESDLSNVRASGSGNVLDRLNESSLSPQQRERVLGVLSEVREHYASVRNGQGVLDAEQEVNWIHTQGELGRVLDAGKAANLSPKDMEKALLASMLSDADKHGRNFFTHHVDGARAANQVLERYKGDGFSTSDIADVIQAIKEHQVGPPGFMAMLYGMRIKGSINEQGANTIKTLEAKPASSLTEAESRQLSELQNAKRGFDSRQAQIDSLSEKESRLALTGEKLSQEELDLRSKLRGQNANGAFVTQADIESINSLTSKISDPHNSALEATSDGRGMQLALNDRERQLLQRTGNDNWFVPSDNSSIRAISETLIAGDSIDNYFTPGGYSKIVKIRGPETGPFFQDKRVDLSINSVRDSGRDAYGGYKPGTTLQGSDPYGVLPGGEGELGRKPFGVMNDQSRSIARAAVKETEESVARAKQEVEQWLRSELNVAPGAPMPDVPYWNSDLKYPIRSEAENRDWWRINATPEAMRSPADAKFWADQRYSGLTPDQIKQFEFAKQIRSRMVEALRAQQRFSPTPSQFPTASSQLSQ